MNEADGGGTAVSPSPSLSQNLLHPAHRAAGQAHLDAMRVRRRLGEDGLNHPFGCFAGALVLLQNNRHALANFDVGSVGSVHICFPGVSKGRGNW